MAGAGGCAALSQHGIVFSKFSTALVRLSGSLSGRLLQKGTILGRKPRNTVQRNRLLHFRRAIPQDLRARFGRSELTCSLGTADLRVADLRARRLYLASETIFSEARRNPMLNDGQLAAIVQDFYGQILGEENRLRLRSSPISEEMRVNRAAWFKKVAERARSDLATNNLGSAWFLSVAMMRKLGLEASLDAEDKAQLRQALLRAGVDLAEAVSARYEGDFNYQPKDALLAQQVDAVFAKTPMAPEATAAAGASRTATPPEATPLFKDVAATFVKKQKQTRRWENQTASQNEKSYDLFIEICGDKQLASYSRKDAAKFKDVLERLPADYGKAARYHGKSPERILEIDASRDSKDPRLSVRTVKRHMSALSTLWDEAIPSGAASENIFAGFKFPHQRRAQEQRPMWTRGDLARLFASPIWTGCKSEARRSTPGPEIIRDERFWLPLIAVFSGCRQEEICQLHVEDLRQEEGIWVLDINMRPPRRLKNKSAVRLVPVHAELIRLGLLDYREETRQAEISRLFPNLEPGGADGRLGHGFTKWFTRYRRDVKLYEPGRDFHSFRHSATTFLHQGDVADSIIDRLTGHTTPGETARYTKGANIEQLKRAIDAIDIGVDLKHLYVANSKYE